MRQAILEAIRHYQDAMRKRPEDDQHNDEATRTQRDAAVHLVDILARELVLVLRHGRGDDVA